MARFSRVRTVGIEQMHTQFSRLVRPHEMELRDQRDDFVSELRYAPLSRTVLSRARVGASMVVRARPAHDMCLVIGAVAQPFEMMIGGRHVFVARGRIAVVPPDTPFVLHIPSGETRSIMLDIERGFLEAIVAEELNDSLPVPLRFTDVGETADESAERGFIELLQFVYRELDRGGPPCASAGFLAHLEAMMACALINTRAHNYTAALRGARADAAPRYVRRAQDYIRAHADEALSLTALAAISAVSPRTLVRGFRKYHGRAPSAYLRDVRLDRARADLLAALPEDGSVTTIALKWGFSNAGRFARLYRERFGENPADTLRRRSTA